MTRICMKDVNRTRTRWFKRRPRAGRISGAVAGILTWASLVRSHANPQGLTVGYGQANVSQSGNHMTLNVSDRATLNWQSFNIRSDESVTFNQPSVASIAWNRILDPNPSQIFGRLQANGTVVFQNSAG